MRTIALWISVGLAGVSIAQQPGTLDSTFAGDGAFEVPLDIASGSSTIRVLHMDDSANVICITNSAQLMRLFRVHHTGALDTTYYGGYHDITAADINSQFGLNSTLIRGVFCSDSIIHMRLTSGTGSHMLRLDFALEPDTTFGIGGLKAIPVNGMIDQIVQGFRGLRSGGYLLWGRYGPPDSDGDLPFGYIMKLDPQGDLDVSFGTAGYVTYFNAISLTGVVVVDEFSDGRIAVGEFYPFMNGQPSGNGLSKMHIYSPAGTVLSSNVLYCYGSDEVLRTTHVTGQDELLTCHGEDLGTLWKRTQDGTYFANGGIWVDANGLIENINSNVDGSILVARPSPWWIGRRLPNLQRDASFGILHPNWGGGSDTRWAQEPANAINGAVTQLFPMANGQLLVTGRSAQAMIARYHNIPDPRAKLDLKLFLGGPMDTNTGLMRDSLRAQGLLHLQQPYLDSTFQSVNGVGAGMTSTSVLNEIGPEAAVDWVWLELLDAADTATMVATRVGLVRRNGKVTSPINHEPIDFSVGAGSYFLRVRHRNHLGVTLSDPITLSDSVVSVDLSDPTTSTFGTAAQKWINGVHMLWPGDVHHDGLIRYAGAANDRDAVLMAVGGTPPTATSTGYKDADVNMDGIVKYAGAENDRDVILQSIGGAHPTAVRFEQRP